MNARGMVAMAGACAVLAGCCPASTCKVAQNAVIAADAACAATALDREDPELALSCVVAYQSTLTSLRKGKCAAELVKP
jgi:hypothetical protein